jgi:muramoyltetrapeptide carboxypeptidase
MPLKAHPENLIIPRRLSPGDTVGIVAPASPFDRELFYRGIAELQAMGYRTSIPPELFMANGYLAGSDAQRAQLVNRFFSDSSIKAIICAKGGFGSIRILPLLDFTVIRKNPKIFVGFSDITALLVVVYSRCNLVTYHGPVITTLGSSDQKTKDGLTAAISSDEVIEMKPARGITLQAGSVTGPVLAGNLATLCHLVGTPYEPQFKGHILLLEDRGEAPYRLDRMLSQMKLAGCFEGLAGLALGSFEGCGQEKQIHTIVKDIFADHAIPILAGLDFGHSPTNITVPIGLEATLDADRQVIVFQSSATTQVV